MMNIEIEKEDVPSSPSELLWKISDMRRDINDLRDMIRLLLPLAKGYVDAHTGVRSTECIIEDAEAMIASKKGYCHE